MTINELLSSSLAEQSGYLQGAFVYIAFVERVQLILLSFVRSLISRLLA